MHGDRALALDSGEVLARWRAAEPTLDGSTAEAVVSALLQGGPAGEVAGALLRFDPTLPVTLRSLRSLRTALHEELRDVPAGECARAHLVLDHLVSDVADRDIAKVAALCLIDPLTALGNRRAADTDLARALAHAERHGWTVSVAMLDLDGLKRINDELGHDAGDAALRRLADAMRATARVDDGVYRLGGDEFLVIAVNSSILDLERLLRRLAVVAPAFSAGVACAPADASEPEPLLAVADQRLYQRKPARREHASNMPAARSRSDVAGVVLVFSLASGLAEALRRALSIDLPSTRMLIWAVLLLGAPAAASGAVGRRARGRTEIGPMAWRAVTLAMALVAALVPLVTFR